MQGRANFLRDWKESQPKDLDIRLSYDAKNRSVRRKSRSEWLLVLRVRWHRIPARSSNFPRLLPDSLAMENRWTTDKNQRNGYDDVWHRSHETRVSRISNIFQRYSIIYDCFLRRKWKENELKAMFCNKFIKFIDTDAMLVSI